MLYKAFLSKKNGTLLRKETLISHAIPGYIWDIWYIVQMLLLIGGNLKKRSLYTTFTTVFYNIG